MVPERALSAEDLAREIGRTIPLATPWTWFLAPRVPTLAEGATGHCKRCGRPLPVFSDPIAFGPMGRFPVVRFERSEMESALLCLVCGPRSRSAQPCTADDIVNAASTITAVLVARHWRRWRRVVQDALDSEHGGRQLESVGQALELLRRFGPGRRARVRRYPVDPLETLVASAGQLWRPRF
jgi:hypothetical protein